MKKMIHVASACLVFLATPCIAQMKPVVGTPVSERPLLVSLQVTDLFAAEELAGNLERNTRWEVIFEKLLSASAWSMTRPGKCDTKNDYGRSLDHRDFLLKNLYQNRPGPPDGRVIHIGRSFSLNH